MGGRGWRRTPPHAYEQVFAEPEPEPPPPPVRPSGLRTVALLAAVVVVAAMVLGAVVGRTTAQITELASAWGTVPMRCKTIRVEQGDRAFELFECRATGGLRLPPGVYRTPDAQWTSDLTRIDARVNEIVITQRGELTGWAAYSRHDGVADPDAARLRDLAVDAERQRLAGVVGPVGADPVEHVHVGDAGVRVLAT